MAEEGPRRIPQWSDPGGRGLERDLAVLGLLETGLGSWVQNCRIWRGVRNAWRLWNWRAQSLRGRGPSLVR